MFTPFISHIAINLQQREGSTGQSGHKSFPYVDGMALNVVDRAFDYNISAFSRLLDTVI
jgi:hypothetical protein